MAQDTVFDATETSQAGRSALLSFGSEGSSARRSPALPSSKLGSLHYEKSIKGQRAPLGSSDGNASAGSSSSPFGGPLSTPAQFRQSFSGTGAESMLGSVSKLRQSLPGVSPVGASSDQTRGIMGNSTVHPEHATAQAQGPSRASPASSSAARGGVAGSASRQRRQRSLRQSIGAGSSISGSPLDAADLRSAGPRSQQSTPATATRPTAAAGSAQPTPSERPTAPPGDPLRTPAAPDRSLAQSGISIDLQQAHRPSARVVARFSARLVDDLEDSRGSPGNTQGAVGDLADSVSRMDGSQSGMATPGASDAEGGLSASGAASWRQVGGALAAAGLGSGFQPAGEESSSPAAPSTGAMNALGGGSRPLTPQAPQQEYLSTVLEATEDGTQGTRGSVSRAGGYDTDLGASASASVAAGGGTSGPGGPGALGRSGPVDRSGVLQVGHHVSAVGSLPGQEALAAPGYVQQPTHSDQESTDEDEEEEHGSDSGSESSGLDACLDEYLHRESTATAAGVADVTAGQLPSDGATGQCDGASREQQGGSPGVTQQGGLQSTAQTPATVGKAPASTASQAAQPSPQVQLSPPASAPAPFPSVAQQLVRPMTSLESARLDPAQDAEERRRAQEARAREQKQEARKRAQAARASRRGNSRGRGRGRGGGRGRIGSRHGLRSDAARRPAELVPTTPGTLRSVQRFDAEMRRMGVTFSPEVQRQMPRIAEEAQASRALELPEGASGAQTVRVMAGSQPAAGSPLAAGGASAMTTPAAQANDSIGQSTLPPSLPDATRSMIAADTPRTGATQGIAVRHSARSRPSTVGQASVASSQGGRPNRRSTASTARRSLEAVPAPTTQSTAGAAGVDVHPSESVAPVAPEEPAALQPQPAAADDSWQFLASNAQGLFEDSQMDMAERATAIVAAAQSPAPKQSTPPVRKVALADSGSKAGTVQGATGHAAASTPERGQQSVSLPVGRPSEQQRATFSVVHEAEASAAGDTEDEDEDEDEDEFVSGEEAAQRLEAEGSRRDAEREAREQELQEELIITKAALARAEARAAGASEGKTDGMTPSSQSWAYGPQAVPPPGTGNTTAAFESAARSAAAGQGQAHRTDRTPNMTPMFAAHSAPLGRISGTKSDSKEQPRFCGEGSGSAGPFPPAARRSLEGAALQAPVVVFDLSSSCSEVGASASRRQAQPSASDPGHCASVETLGDDAESVPSTVDKLGSPTLEPPTISASLVPPRHHEPSTPQGKGAPSAAASTPPASGKTRTPPLRSPPMPIRKVRWLASGHMRKQSDDSSVESAERPEGSSTAQTIPATDAASPPPAAGAPRVRDTQVPGPAPRLGSTPVSSTQLPQLGAAGGPQGQLASDRPLLHARRAEMEIANTLAPPAPASIGTASGPLPPKVRLLMPRKLQKGGAYLSLASSSSARKMVPLRLAVEKEGKFASAGREVVVKAVLVAGETDGFGASQVQVAAMRGARATGVSLSVSPSSLSASLGQGRSGGGPVEVALVLAGRTDPAAVTGTQLPVSDGCIQLQLRVSIAFDAHPAQQTFTLPVAVEVAQEEHTAVARAAIRPQSVRAKTDSTPSAAAAQPPLSRPRERPASVPAPASSAPPAHSVARPSAASGGTRGLADPQPTPAVSIAPPVGQALEAQAADGKPDRPRRPRPNSVGPAIGSQEARIPAAVAPPVARQSTQHHLHARAPVQRGPEDSQADSTRGRIRRSPHRLMAHRRDCEATQPAERTSFGLSTAAPAAASAGSSSHRVQATQAVAWQSQPQPHLVDSGTQSEGAQSGAPPIPEPATGAIGPSVMRKQLRDEGTQMTPQKQQGGGKGSRSPSYDEAFVRQPMQRHASVGTRASGGAPCLQSNASGGKQQVAVHRPLKAAKKPEMLPSSAGDDSQIDSLPASPAQPRLSRSGREVLGQQVQLPPDERVVASPVDAVRGLLGRTSQQHPDHTASGGSLEVASAAGASSKGTSKPAQEISQAPLGVSGPKRVAQSAPEQHEGDHGFVSPVSKFVNGIASALARRRAAVVAAPTSEPVETTAQNSKDGENEARGKGGAIRSTDIAAPWEVAGGQRDRDDASSVPRSSTEPPSEASAPVEEEQTESVTAPESRSCVEKSLAIVVAAARDGAMDSTDQRDQAGGGIASLSPVARQPKNQGPTEHPAAEASHPRLAADRVMARDLEREMEGVGSIEHDLEDARSRKGTGSTDSLPLPRVAVPAESSSPGPRELDLDAAHVPEASSQTPPSNGSSRLEEAQDGVTRGLASAMRHVRRARDALHTQPKDRKKQIKRSPGHSTPSSRTERAHKSASRAAAGRGGKVHRAVGRPAALVLGSSSKGRGRTPVDARLLLEGAAGGHLSTVGALQAAPSPTGGRARKAKKAAPRRAEEGNSTAKGALGGKTRTGGTHRSVVSSAAMPRRTASPLRRSVAAMARVYGGTSSVARAGGSSSGMRPPLSPRPRLVRSVSGSSIASSRSGSTRLSSVQRLTESGKRRSPKKKSATKARGTGKGKGKKGSTSRRKAKKSRARKARPDAASMEQARGQERSTASIDSDNGPESIAPPARTAPGSAALSRRLEDELDAVCEGRIRDSLPCESGHTATVEDEGSGSTANDGTAAARDEAATVSRLVRSAVDASWVSDASGARESTASSTAPPVAAAAAGGMQGASGRPPRPRSSPGRASAGGRSASNRRSAHEGTRDRAGSQDSGRNRSGDSSRSVGEILGGVGSSPASLWGAVDAFRSPVQRARAAAERRNGSGLNVSVVGGQDTSRMSAAAASSVGRASAGSSLQHSLATADETLAEAASVQYGGTTEAANAGGGTTTSATGIPSVAGRMRRLDFPAVRRGNRAAKRFRLRNSSGYPLVVRAQVEEAAEEELVGVRGAVGGAGSFEVATRHSRIELPPHSYCLIPVSYGPGVRDGVRGAGKDVAVLRVWSQAAREEDRDAVARKGVRLGAVALLVGRRTE